MANRKNNYKKGDWNVICDVCGFKKRASEVRLRWDGLYVCQEDWETRHPQEFLRTPKDDTSVPFTRPEPSDIEIEINGCSLLELGGGADYGTADCARASVDTNEPVPSGTFNLEI